MSFNQTNLFIEMMNVLEIFLKMSMLYMNEMALTFWKC